VSVLIHTEGIIVRTIKYGESSIISHVLTEKLGLLSLIMSGVSSGNNKSGMFQIMNQLELVIYYQDAKPMHRIKEARYARMYQTLPFEIQRSAVGIFLLEMVRKCLTGVEKDQELYHWVKSGLDYADQDDSPLGWLPLYFSIGFTRYLGFRPFHDGEPDSSYFDLREGRFSSEIPFHVDYLDKVPSGLLQDILGCSSPHELNQLALPSKMLRKELLKAILDYYRFHLDHFKGLDSPQILEEILTA